MDKLEFKERLELVSRVGTVLLVALYGAGFMVVSFHDARYGIMEFGFFRARLLSAGIIFGIFFGLPFLEASRIFGLFGLQPLKLLLLQRKGNSEPSAPVARLLQVSFFFTASWGTAFCVQLLLAGFDMTWSLGFVSVGYAVVASVVFVAIRLGALRNSAIRLIAVLGTIAASLVALVLIRQWSYLWVLAWFVLVGWLAHGMDSPIREPHKLVQVNWHWTVLNIILVFGLFAVVLYPKIQPAFGGGQPIRVILQFDKVSPIDNSPKNDVWLIDETDGGYYVTRTPQNHTAIFVPRSLVSAVYFEPRESASQH